MLAQIKDGMLFASGSSCSWESIVSLDAAAAAAIATAADQNSLAVFEDEESPQYIAP